MKKLLLMLLCFALVAGCRPVAVTPPTVTTPDPQPAKATMLVRATLSAGGKEFELQFGNEEHAVYDVIGELRLEFSAPVDLASLASSESFEYANEDFTVLRSVWPSWIHRIDALTSLRDTNGQLVSWDGSHVSLTRVPYPEAKFSIVGHPYVEANGFIHTLLAPGETVRIEFNGEIVQDFVYEQLWSGLFAEYRENDWDPLQRSVPDFTLEWEDDRALHLTINGSVNWSVGLRPQGLNIGHYFYIVPNQRVVVLNASGEVLSQTDVPLSMYRALAMDKDYSVAKLVRTRGEDSWPMSSLTPYTLDLKNGKLTQTGIPLVTYGWRERYVIYDWMQQSRMTYGRVGDGSYRACGLSNDGRFLAVYRQGEIRLHDLATGSQQTITIPIRPRDDGDEPSPHWMYWAADDSRLFYNTTLDDDWHRYGLYTLDLGTEEDSLVISDHYLLHASPLSDHLFTRAYLDLDDWRSYTYNIVDYTGNVNILGSESEHVALAKWIDADRVLLNKYSASPAGTSWKCFIYHIGENRWQPLAEGYGFDYDANTGRVFLLQER